MRRTTGKSLAVAMVLLLLFSLLPTGAFAANEWQPNTAYNVGDLVTYNGSTYKCLQSHTSLVGWEPPRVPALWQLTNNDGGDTQAPNAPTNLTSPAQTSTSIALSWTASTDNIGVTEYEIYRGSAKVGSTPTTSYTDTGLAADTSYSYTVKAKDAAGNLSNASNALTVKTKPNSETPDQVAPSAPSNLTSPAQTSTSITLTWTASTDNVGVVGYDIYRGGSKVGSSTTTSYSDMGLTANTSYTYTVKARDLAGNVSAASNALTVKTKTDSNPGSHKIVAYYTAWSTYARNYQIADIDASKLTHINYGFANISGGEIVVGDTYADTDKFFPGDCWDPGCKRGNFNQLTKLKEKYPHLKTLISVGGWTWSGGFSDAAATDASRTRFADSAVRFVREYGFDGVDLDWEFPVSGGLNPGRPEDKQNFTLLLQKVREKLDAAGQADGKRYLLTIASGSGPSYYETNTEIDKVKDYLDWINIMTYDYHGSWETVSGHNAPLYADPSDPSPQRDTFNIDATVNGYLRKGVPASKLVLGMPFYGRGWAGCSTANNGQFQSCTGASQGTWENGVFDFSDLEANYINKNGYTRYWNNTSKVPYLYNPSNKVFISYDDAESIGYKTSYLKSKGLAGAMFWELSGDRNKTLLNKLYQDLHS